MATVNESDALQIEFQAGKAAFERGDYRNSVDHLERAVALVNPNSGLGGTVQIWLVTAYQAAGQSQAAIALCRTLTTHPDITTRKEGKRILYILEAPKLQARPDWFTQIPDLGTLAEKPDHDRPGAQMTSSAAAKAISPSYQVDSTDLSQVNTEDKWFLWVAVVLMLLILGSLLWLM